MVLIVTSAAEWDGKLVKIGRRLLSTPIMELLNFVWADVFEGLDGKQRRHLLASFEGRVGPDGGILVDDPDLPAEMQGMEAPAWWDADYDPMSSTFSVE